MRPSGPAEGPARPRSLRTAPRAALAYRLARLACPYLAIFDHDGVLVDSLAFHQDAWVELGRRTGLALTAEFIHETFGMTNPSIFRKLLGDALDPVETQRYSDLKEVCYREMARGKIALMAGVRELLDDLTAAGVLLAIGSSGVRPNLDLTVESCGLIGPVRRDRVARRHRARQARPRRSSSSRRPRRASRRRGRSSSRTPRSASRPRRPPACTPWA